MGGLLPIVSETYDGLFPKNGFIPRSQISISNITSPTDVDKLNSGVHSVYIGDDAYSYNIPIKYGHIAVFESKDNKFQIAIDSQGTAIFARARWNNWSSWRKVTLSTVE